MASTPPIYIQSITDFHRLMGLPKPAHSLVSLVRFENLPHQSPAAPGAIVHNFYSVALKKSLDAKLRYGQQAVDFDEGTLLFMAPRQVFSVEGPQESVHHTGWLLLIHPDLLWSTPLAQKIRQYEFFDYKVNEALHLSASEEQLLVGLMQQLAGEANNPTDLFSQPILVTQFELLLTYAQRFYQRQFITRTVSNHQLISRFEELLHAYCSGDQLTQQGIPPVTYFSDALCVSSGYLSRLLKTLTGQNTQQHIQNRLVEKAKEHLSTTSLSVNEIAYQLGFEHPPSFSKFFKSKTRLSPLAFRQALN